MEGLGAIVTCGARPECFIGDHSNARTNSLTGSKSLMHSLIARSLRCDDANKKPLLKLALGLKYFDEMRPIDRLAID